MFQTAAKTAFLRFRRFFQLRRKRGRVCTKCRIAISAQQRVFACARKRRVSGGFVDGVPPRRGSDRLPFLVPVSRRHPKTQQPDPPPRLWGWERGVSHTEFPMKRPIGQSVPIENPYERAIGGSKRPFWGLADPKIWPTPEIRRPNSHTPTKKPHLGVQTPPKRGFRTPPKRGSRPPPKRGSRPPPKGGFGPPPADPRTPPQNGQKRPKNAVLGVKTPPKGLVNPGFGFICFQNKFLLT